MSDASDTPPDDSPRFAHGVVVTPHHLASTAGASVLAQGGNAIDAAVAANLVLAVVTPYHCGLGGDLVALIADGGVHALTSIGAAPHDVDVEALRDAARGHDAPATLASSDGVPATGPHSVTVPGAVAGLFAMLGRFGSMSFDEVARTACHLAEHGFLVSPHADAHIQRGLGQLGDRPAWRAQYAGLRAGSRWRQPEHAALLRTLGAEGPEAFYRGDAARAIVRALQAEGGRLSLDDLAAHEVLEPEPVELTMALGTLHELPPPSQGVTATLAVALAEQLTAGVEDPGLRAHLQVEASRLALAERQRLLGDDSSADPLGGLDVATLSARVDHDAPLPLPDLEPGGPGTAFVAVTDADGRAVSLSQSNFVGFGSGVVVPELGIGLHNRGAHFRLAEGHPNELRAGARPLHTLVPALVTDTDGPVAVIGTMGGDAQVPIQVQLLDQLARGIDPTSAVATPRWKLDVGEGTVAIEADADERLTQGLVQRGHQVRRMAARDHRAGHANIVHRVPGGYAAGADPRSEGSAAGW